MFSIEVVQEIHLQSIAVVRNGRTEILDDDWGAVVSEIVLSDEFPEDALQGIEEFSHLEIIFFFDRVDEDRIVRQARHPRGNSNWPRVGIFAQRGKNRPNRLGLTVVKLLEHRGRVLRVTGLDAIDGTPVLDIKPVMREFLPREDVRQPEWAVELMKGYW